MKNIESQSYGMEFHISILKNKGWELGSILKQVQTQDSGQMKNIESQSYGIASQISILKTKDRTLGSIFKQAQT